MSLSLTYHVDVVGQRHAVGHDVAMAALPRRPKHPCTAAVRRARERWPQLAGVHVSFRGQFAYVTGRLTDGEPCR